MDYINRYVRSEQCRKQCGDDCKEEGENIHPPDYDLNPCARFVRSCGCPYSVVRNRIVDPSKLAYTVDYYVVRPEQHFSYGKWNIIFHGLDYESDKEILMPVCRDCFSGPLQYGDKPHYRVLSHDHDVNLRSKLYPENWYKQFSDLSEQYVMMCRKDRCICVECKKDLYTFDQCDCENETVMAETDEFTDNVDFERMNNSSPIPDFSVTDKGFFQLPDDSDLDYLVSLYDTYDEFSDERQTPDLLAQYGYF